MEDLIPVFKRLSVNTNNVKNLHLQLDSPSPLNQDLKLMLESRRKDEKLEDLQFLELGQYFFEPVDQTDFRWLEERVKVVKRVSGMPDGQKSLALMEPIYSGWD